MSLQTFVTWPIAKTYPAFPFLFLFLLNFTFLFWHQHLHPYLGLTLYSDRGVNCNTQEWNAGICLWWFLFLFCWCTWFTKPIFAWVMQVERKVIWTLESNLGQLGGIINRPSPYGDRRCIKWTVFFCVSWLNIRTKCCKACSTGTQERHCLI